MAKEKEREAWTQVILLYKELSYLYDKEQKEYFNRELRQKAYNMLLQVYNEAVGKTTTLAELKKRLENMRASYGRELKKVIASKVSGYESGAEYVPSLWYYSLFEFLDVTMRSEPCHTGTYTLDETQNLGSPEIGETSSENKQVYEEISADPIKTSPHKKQKMTFQKRHDHALLTQKDQALLTQKDRALLTQKDDDWEIIGKSIAIQMRGLRTHQQVIAQKIISDAIFYGKLGRLTDESRICLAPQHISYPTVHIPQRYYSSPGSSVTNTSPQQSPKYIVPSPDDLHNL